MAKFKNQCSDSWDVYVNRITKGKILPTSYPLRIATIAGSYKDLLYLDNNNAGITSTFKNIYDGEGKALKIKASNSSFEIDTNGGQISDPVVGSSVTYLNKIDLSNTEVTYEVDAKNSCNILFYYSNPGSSDQKTYNISVNLEYLFENINITSDEFLTAEFKFHLISYSFSQITLIINFIYKTLITENQIFLSVPGGSFPNISNNSAIVYIYTFPSLQIESAEIANA